MRLLSIWVSLAWAAVLMAAPERPNVILIVADDLGYADLSCTGLADDVSTPNLDRLARSGVRYTEAYATAPICNASRIAILTGCYQQRQGQYWYSGPGLHREDLPTIAEVLSERGYATGFVGKFHHGAGDRPGKRGFPLAHGYASSFGFAGGTKHYLRHGEAGELHKLMHAGPMWDGSESRTVAGFATTVFGERARAFVAAKKDEPFFLHLSFSAVHNFTHQLPDDYLKEHGLPRFPDVKAGEDYWAWRKKLGYPAHPHGRDYYLGQLRYLDLEIGRLLDQLAALGIDDKTAILFVSDNGGSLVTYAKNGALRGGKYTLLEGGIRVPMLMRVPWLRSPQKLSDRLVSTLDLVPTICELTGAQQPALVDGRSLLAAAEPRALFWDTGHQQAVRHGKWKLLVTKQTPNARLQIEPTPKGTFLYDLAADPGERRDLSRERPELVQELRQRLTAWQKKTSSAGR